jgi:choline dehydrogenase-like flavoprotein
MIRDLAAPAGQTHDVACDVLVGGGGTVGLLLATRLAAAGKHVVVAESGGLSQSGETRPLNEVVLLGAPYKGAETGRFRCLGGTSTRWGGAMLPFLETDMTFRQPGWDSEWPVTLADFTAYQGEIERLFGLPESPYDRPEILPGRNGSAAAFIPRLAKWPPFKLRNVATLVDAQIKAENGPAVWLNATATQFGFDPGGRLVSVEARSPNGGRLLVRPAETVIAAGAIESTRLLLLIDHQNDNRLFAPDGVLGRYFHDHVSTETARVVVSDRTALNRVIGFRFEGGGMRNLRFEPSAGLRAAHRLPAGFLHIAFSTEAPTGFDVLRSVYRKVQRRDRLTVGDAAELASALPWLSRAAWWRFREKRLLFPDNAIFGLHAVVEQEPLAANRIALSPQRVDAFGCPLASIDWRVADSDIANVAQLTQQFVTAWRESPLGHLAEIQPAPPEALGEALSSFGGVYHPGGSIKMGASPKTGVVDKDLQTFRAPNLSVLSTAVFPSGGGANPTMMLMMAALRLADRLKAG